ncbi:MAG: DUF2569 family protein [Candidatus Saccharimonadales bacterium]
MKSSKESFDELKKLIISFDNDIANNKITDTKAEKYQKKLDELAEIFQYDTKAGNKRYMLYELQALIEIYKGNKSRAVDFADEAKDFMSDDDDFISKRLKQLYVKPNETSELTVISKVEKPQKKDKIAPSIGGWLILYLIGFVISICYTVYDGLSLMRIDTAGIDSRAENYIIAAIYIDIALVLCGIALLFSMYQKRKYVIKYVQIYQLCLVIMYFMMATWLNNILHILNYSDGGDNGVNRLYSASFWAFVWFVYWYRSKRVKNTFIK